MQRLADLNPSFVFHGGDGVTRNGKPVPKREGVGLGFDCPCGCGDRTYVDFANPVDGGPPIQTDKRHTWQRTGEDFETLTLSPSILRTKPHGCGWHGFIENGGIRTV